MSLIKLVRSIVCFLFIITWQVAVAEENNVYFLINNPNFGTISELANNLLIGYDHVTTFSFQDYDQEDEDPEAKKAYIKVLKKIAADLKAGNKVDIFVFSHSNSFYQDLEKHIGKEDSDKIRLLYNSGCHDGKDAKKYVEDLGVDAYVGHDGKSCSPLFLPSFAMAWNLGFTVAEAVDYGNDSVAAGIYIPSPASSACLISTSQWPKEAIKNTHAEAYGDSSIYRDSSSSSSDLGAFEKLKSDYREVEDQILEFLSGRQLILMYSQH